MPRTSRPGQAPREGTVEAVATLNNDGTGMLMLDGKYEPIHENDPGTARLTVMRKVQERAAAAGVRVVLEATDSSGVTRIAFTPSEPPERLPTLPVLPVSPTVATSPASPSAPSGSTPELAPTPTPAPLAAMDPETEQTVVAPLRRRTSATTRAHLLTFSTGDSATVAGAGYIGRRPVLPPDAAGQSVVVTDHERSVSRTHLQFDHTPDGHMWIFDLGSANGTRIVSPDGTRVECQAGRRYFVEPGDRVEIGDSHHFTVAREQR